MHKVDETLAELINAGRKQGYLTFTQVNAYLPNEAVNPEKLDNLLMSLEELGMEIVAEEASPDVVHKKRRQARLKPINGVEMEPEEGSRRIDDPIRM